MLARWVARRAVWEQALEHLSAADPAMAGLIARVGPCELVPDPSGTHFEALLRSIVYQQLSGKAAGTIHGRVLALFGPEAPTPEALLALNDESLRGAGLSRGKLAAARALATRWLEAPPSDDASQLDDEAIVTALVSIHGIGRWSAQMFLTFRLGRPDVFPVTDLGVRKGAMRLDRLEAMPSPKELERRGEVWRPHATVASWYLWRACEPSPDVVL